MNQDKEFLGREPVGKLLFKLALPTVVAQLINMLYNIVDRIYIGHMPGDGALALTGVGVCMPIIMIVTAFAALVGAGGAPRASIFMGQKDQESAERTLGGCFAVQILLSVALTLVLLIWNKPLLMAFGGSENTIGYATAYMNIYAIGTIFVQMTLGMNAFITAQGFTKTSMLAVVIGALTNIILDPILIFGFHMGVRGAALATIISQLLSTIWVLAFLMGKKTILKIKKEYIRLDRKIVVPCLTLGLATFVMQARESVISVCFNASLLRYGGDIAVGAMTILTSVMMFAMLPLQGITMGSQPIISYNYGARKADRVKRTFWILVAVCLGYSMTLWVFVMGFPKLFARIFSPDTALQDYTSHALRIYAAGLGIFGIQSACQMTFTSLGKALNSIIVAVFRKFILLVPLIYIIPAFMENKVDGVYMAEPISDVLAVTFTSILFFFQFRKAMREIEGPREVNA